MLIYNRRQYFHPDNDPIVHRRGSRFFRRGNMVHLLVSDCHVRSRTADGSALASFQPTHVHVFFNNAHLCWLTDNVSCKFFDLVFGWALFDWCWRRRYPDRSNDRRYPNGERKATWSLHRIGKYRHDSRSLAWCSHRRRLGAHSWLGEYLPDSRGKKRMFVDQSRNLCSGSRLP